MKNIFIMFLCLLAILSISQKKVLASNYQYTIIDKKKINISEESFKRLIDFSNGSFYSKVYGQKIIQAIGLYFALSDKGNIVAFSFCEDDMIGCNTNLLEYQTKATCEKISKEHCNIIAVKNNLILNKQMILLNNQKALQEYFDIYKNSNLPFLSYEIRAQNLRDFGNDDYQ